MDGNRISIARKQKGYTLKRVAEMTGYSTGYISLLERNKKQPSLTALRRIAACLECSEVWLIMGQIYEHDEGECSISSEEVKEQYVIKRENRIPMQLPEIDVGYSIFTPSNLPGNKKANMTGLIVHLKPGSWVSEKMISHKNYDESVFILKGELELHLGNEVHEVKEGDSFYVPKEMLHNYLNTSLKEEVICIVYFSKLIY